MRLRFFNTTFGKWTARLGLVAAVGIVAAALTVGAAAKAPKFNISDQPIDREARQPASYAPIVKKVAACVVNIYSTRTIKEQPMWHPYMNDPCSDDSSAGTTPNPATTPAPARTSRKALARA